mgnify:FL=1
MLQMLEPRIDSSLLQTKADGIQDFVHDTIRDYFLAQKSFTKRFSFLPSSTNYYWVNNGLELFKSYCETQGVPDVIHAHSALYGGRLALSIKKQFNIPFILTEHSSFLLQKKLPWWQLKMARAVYRNSYLNIAVSRYLKEKIQQNFNLDKEKWRVLPNMINDSFFVSELHQPAKEKFIFLIIGMLIHVKGHHKLLKAFALVSEQLSLGTKIRIVGDGPQKESLLNLAKELGIESQIEWHDSVPSTEIAHMIQDAHVIVSSSEAETFGLVLVEALALGRPVVALDSGGPRDIVNDSVGFLIPQGFIEDFSQALVNIQKNYSNYSPEKLRHYTQERFHSSVIINSLYSAYKEIVA